MKNTLKLINIPLYSRLQNKDDTVYNYLVLSKMNVVIFRMDRLSTKLL